VQSHVSDTELKTSRPTTMTPQATLFMTPP